MVGYRTNSNAFASRGGGGGGGGSSSIPYPILSPWAQYTMYLTIRLIHLRGRDKPVKINGSFPIFPFEIEV